MIAAMLLGGIALALVGLRWPALGLGLAAAVDLVQVGGVSIGGVTVAPESFFFLYMASVPFLQRLVNDRLPPHSTAQLWPIAALFGAFALACLLSSVLGGMSPAAAQIYARLPLWCVFFLSAAWLLHTERDYLLVIRALVGGALLLLLLLPFVGFPTETDQGGMLRTGYLNPLGHALGLCAVLAYSIAGSGRAGLAARGIGLLLGCGMLATDSRGALLASTAAFLVAWWTKAGPELRRRAKLLTWAAAPVLVVVACTGLISKPVHAFVTQERSSNLYRVQIAQLSWRLFTESPLSGTGLGNFQTSSALHSRSLRALTDNIVSADNDYARILGELGILGILFLLFMCVRVTRGYRQALRATTPGARPPILVSGAALAAFLVVLALFESVLFTPSGWFLLGLCAAIPQAVRR